MSNGLMRSIETGLELAMTGAKRCECMPAGLTTASLPRTFFSGYRQPFVGLRCANPIHLLFLWWYRLVFWWHRSAVPPISRRCAPPVPGAQAPADASRRKAARREIDRSPAGGTARRCPPSPGAWSSGGTALRCHPSPGAVRRGVPGRAAPADASRREAARREIDRSPSGGTARRCSPSPGVWSSGGTARRCHPSPGAVRRGGRGAQRPLMRHAAKQRDEQSMDWGGGDR